MLASINLLPKSETPPKCKSSAQHGRITINVPAKIVGKWKEKADAGEAQAAPGEEGDDFFDGYEGGNESGEAQGLSASELEDAELEQVLAAAAAEVEV